MVAALSPLAWWRLGEPSGTLHEGAMHAVEALAPRTTPEEWEEGLLKAQAYLHSLGITAWQDAIVGGSYDTFDAYLAVAGRGELTARVIGALWWQRDRGLEQIEDLVARRERGRVGRFAATSVKIMQDGVCENFTAAMSVRVSWVLELSIFQAVSSTKSRSIRIWA